MKSSLILTVVALVSVSAAQAHASYITLSDPDNVAPLATVSTSSAANSNGAELNNRLVSDGVPGELTFEDTGVHFMFLDAQPSYAVVLNWTTPQNLKSLQAYICQGGAGDADRTVSSIEFFVDNAGDSNWDYSTVVATANTNDVGCFDLTKADGNWSNVSRVGFAFTGSSGTQGPRVAEVLAISSVPEPSTLVLLVGGLLGLLAYAWRKRN